MNNVMRPLPLAGRGDLLPSASGDAVNLARSVARARSALQGHRSRCFRHGVDCRRCAIYEAALHNAIRDLNAVLPRSEAA